MTIEAYTINDTVLVDRCITFIARTILCNEELTVISSSDDARYECWPIEICRVYLYDYIEGTYSLSEENLSVMTDEQIIDLLQDQPNLALGVYVFKLGVCIVDSSESCYIMARPASLL